MVRAPAMQPLYTGRILTVAALNGEIYSVALLYSDSGSGIFTELECLGHILFAAVGECAVKFAEMTAETPVLVYINSFHGLLLPPIIIV